MKNLKLILTVTIGLILLSQCKEDFFNEDLVANRRNGTELPNAVPHDTFTVMVENISMNYDYFAAGAQFIPDNKSSAGPAFPGESFTVTFHAGKVHKLSFASMYGASNDLFYSPSEEGISLFNGDDALTGDITELISLWDAGTEENHAPGSGEGGADESEPIKSLRNIDNVNDGFDYNSVEENIEVMLEYDGVSMFTLTIHVLEGSSTPLSPVAWVVHYPSQKPIFTENELDYGNGLEMLAETGNAGPLSEYLTMHSGYVSPIAPVVWVVHKQGEIPIFKEGKPDYEEGLETLAETGDPSMVYNSLMEQNYKTGVASIPDGGVDPAPIFPGESYTFEVTAKVGDYLSIATMLGKSNDIFFSPGDKGIRLFKGNTGIYVNVTDHIDLYDAGTEVNEYPGAGINQGAGEGIEEANAIMLVDDEFIWPEANEVIKVTIMTVH